MAEPLEHAPQRALSRPAAEPEGVLRQVADRLEADLGERVDPRTLDYMTAGQRRHWTSSTPR